MTMTPQVATRPPVAARGLAPSAPRAQETPRTPGQRRRQVAPYLFLLPYLLITAVFFLYPLIYAGILAFYQTNGPTQKAYVGMSNFSFVVRDPDFHTALKNTVI